jgi:hypothetical protein
METNIGFLVAGLDGYVTRLGIGTRDHAKYEEPSQFLVICL